MFHIYSRDIPSRGTLRRSDGRAWGQLQPYLGLWRPCRYEQQIRWSWSLEDLWPGQTWRNFLEETMPEAQLHLGFVIISEGIYVHVCHHYQSELSYIQSLYQMALPILKSHMSHPRMVRGPGLPEHEVQKCSRKASAHHHRRCL
jgi:hypothetical protein